jgi:preprotein translocase subunit SecD
MAIHKYIVQALLVGIVAILGSCAKRMAEREVFMVRSAQPVDSMVAGAIQVNDKPYLPGPILVRTADLVDAFPELSKQNRPQVSIEITSAAGNRLSAASDQYLNQPLLIYVDGELINSPIARASLGKRLAITAKNQDEANAVALRLKSVCKHP